MRWVQLARRAGHRQEAGCEIDDRAQPATPGRFGAHGLFVCPLGEGAQVGRATALRTGAPGMRHASGPRDMRPTANRPCRRQRRSGCAAMTKRLLYIQMLRALAANAVLLYHISFIEKKYTNLPPSYDKLYELGTFGYDVFFVLSGCIMYIININTSSRTFLFDRIVRIYPIYWFYTTLVIFVFFFYPAAVNSSSHQTPTLWRSYLLFPDFVHPHLIVGWTLVLEMYFYLTFALVLACRARMEWAVAVWGVFVIVGVVALGDIIAVDEPLWYTVLHPLTLEFIAGVLIGSLIRSGRVKFAGWALLGGIGWIVIVVAVVPDAYRLGGLARVALVLPAAGLVVYGLAVLDIRGQSTPPRWLVRLGDASYSVYLCQIFVISAVGRLYFRFPSPDWVPPDIARAALVLVCLVATNVGGLLSYRFIERPTMRMLTQHLRPQYLRMVAGVTRRQPRMPYTKSR